MCTYESVRAQVFLHTQTCKKIFSGDNLVLCWKAPRWFSTAGEIRSVWGQLQRVYGPGRSQPPARPNTSKLGRRNDFRVWGSVLEIHPEPTLKTEVARLHWPWRSNRAKMQAAGFAVPVFNYWYFKQCKSVLSTQQEKIHLYFVLMQLVSWNEVCKLQQDELTVTKVQLRSCWK